MEPAAELAGISSDTMRRWLNRGKSSEQPGASDPYALLYRAYKTAEASVEAEVTRNIIKASAIPAHWAAGATYVERKHPERWGRPGERNQATTQQIIVHVGGNGDDVRIGISQLSPAQSTLQSETLSNVQQKASESDNRSSVNLDSRVIAKELAPSLPTSGYAQRVELEDASTVWSAGAATRQGTLVAAAPAPTPAASNTKSTSSTEPAATEHKSTELALASELEGPKAKSPGLKKGQSRKGIRLGPPAVERDASQVTKTDRRYANPAAARRAAKLHAEGKRRRRAAKTARRLKDAERHAANTASKKAKEAQLAEAALPEDVTG